MTQPTKRTIHVNFRVRAVDDVQSPDPGALCFRKGEVAVVTEIELVGNAYGTYNGKKGWFALADVMEEPNSPRNSNNNTSPRSGSNISSTSPTPSPGGSVNSGIAASAAQSPPSGRNPPPKPTARKLSSFIWKTREDRQNEITGSGMSPAIISLVEDQSGGEDKNPQSKKPSDMIKMRLMWRKSVNEKPVAAHPTKRHEFGVTIEELSKGENAPRRIPYVVFVCISHLAEHALDLEGVFRISVSFPDLLEMKEMLETGLPRFMDPGANSHVVASILKQFFRELPDPLLTFLLYDRWMNTGELPNMDERKQKLIALIKELPESNQRTLHFLMTFLKALSLRSEVNKMSTLNLGVVFAPTILRRKVETKDDFMRMETQRGIVETFLDDYDEIFPKLFPPKSAEGGEGQKEEDEDVPWSEERLLGLLRPTERELLNYRRGSFSAGSVIVGLALREDSSSHAYIRENSPSPSPTGSVVDSDQRINPPSGEAAQTQPSSQPKAEQESTARDDDGSSDSDGEEDATKGPKKANKGRSRASPLDKSKQKEEKERERERRKKEKQDRKEEKRKKEREKEKDKKGKDESGTVKKGRGSIVFAMDGNPLPRANMVSSSPVRRSESPKQEISKRRAATASTLPPMLENGAELKRRLTADSEAGSLTDRVVRPDEKASMDLGALAQELAVQVEALKNEGKFVEVENENKRLEWVWLEQEKEKITLALQILRQELEEKKLERARLEEENQRLKSENSACHRPPEDGLEAKAKE